MGSLLPPNLSQVSCCCWSVMGCRTDAIGWDGDGSDLCNRPLPADCELRGVSTEFSVWFLAAGKGRQR